MKTQIFNISELSRKITGKNNSCRHDAVPKHLKGVIQECIDAINVIIQNYKNNEKL